MNLALVHYNFGGTVGGVEFVMEAHVNLLTAHECRVEVICGSSESSAPWVETWRELRANAAPMDPVALEEKLETRLRGFDVVLIHNVLTMPFNLALTQALVNVAAANSGTRWIAWIHDLAAANSDYPDCAENPLFRRAHPGVEYVAVSEQRRAEFKRLTGADARVIPNGIDPMRTLNLTPAVETLAREHSLWQRDLILLLPARLIKRKNLELAIRVVSELKKKNANATAIITGPPDLYHPHAANYQASLRALAHECGVERDLLFIDFPVTKSDLASLYSIADALFFPSKQEGFGIPLLEAAVHRLPVFCSDLEATKEIAPSTAILFSPSADPALIARMIIEHPDPARAARKRVVRDFSWDTIYTRYLLPLLNPR